MARELRMFEAKALRWLVGRYEPVRDGDVEALEELLEEMRHEGYQAGWAAAHPLGCSRGACLSILEAPIPWEGQNVAKVVPGATKALSAHMAMREKACRWLEASVPAIVRDLDGVPQEVL